MKTDQSFESIFDQFQPELEENLFMERLSKKLDAVEYLKKEHDYKIRTYRYTLLASILVAVFSCGILLLVLVLNPDLFTLTTETAVSFLGNSSVGIWLSQHGQTLLFAVMFMMMAIGGIGIVQLTQELLEHKREFEEYSK